VHGEPVTRNAALSKDYLGIVNPGGGRSPEGSFFPAEAGVSSLGDKDGKEGASRSREEAQHPQENFQRRSTKSD
jgi:hypothetical protein